MLYIRKGTKAEGRVKHEKISEWFKEYVKSLPPQPGVLVDDLEHIYRLLCNEEQGLLLELPVRIGEVVYSAECGEIITDSLYAVNKDNKGLWAINQYGGIIGRFGHTVFATRSEAEEALAKMGGKRA